MAASLVRASANPADTDLDAFDSDEPEVNHYFSSRQWYVDGKHKPDTYEFRTADKGALVGYAAATFGNLHHPELDSPPPKARYLIIYVAGVHKRFHRKQNPAAPGERYSASLFKALEDLAREKANTVGLHLRVRSSNARAIGFYRSFGFAQTGPLQPDAGGGDPYQMMRKPLL